MKLNLIEKYSYKTLTHLFADAQAESRYKRTGIYFMLAFSMISVLVYLALDKEYMLTWFSIMFFGFFTGTIMCYLDYRLHKRTEKSLKLLIAEKDTVFSQLDPNNCVIALVYKHGAAIIEKRGSSFEVAIPDRGKLYFSQAYLSVTDNVRISEALFGLGEDLQNASLKH
jgi:hypothetical protein